MAITRKTTVLALLVTTALCAVAEAQSAPQITGIELGQAGIARYTMTADARGAQISFVVPEAASSDVLASLVVRDPAGGVVDVQTDTPGAAAAALRETLFGTGVPTDTGQLLGALQGEEVTLTTAAGEMTGKVMGLRRFDAVEGGQRVDRLAVILLGASGVTEVVLTPGVKIGFSEAAARHLSDILNAQVSKPGTRRFDLTLEADTARAVQLSYVTEAAAWKNSWRLLLDEGRLQGWAAFENVSGADWEDVQLTLTTGAPVAFRRDLIDPLFIPRQDQDSTRPAPVAARADPGVLGLTSMFSGGSARTLSQDLAPVVPPSGTATDALALQSGGILRYALPDEVDLANGRTANVMYLDLPIEPEIRGLYRPDADDERVLLAARLQADQPLASGLVSVQDTSGFVGDAPFLGMLAGESRLLPFAVATGSETLADRDDVQRLTSLAHQDGSLVLGFERVLTTTYTATLPGTVDVFTVEHPMGEGRLDSHSGTAETIRGYYRVSVPAEEGRAMVSLVEKQTGQKTIRIGRSDFATLIADIETGRIEVSAAHRAAFETVIDLKSEAEATDRAASAAKRRYAALTEEQKRLRDNLSSVTQDALRTRYLDALARTEAEIAEAFDAMGRYADDLGRIEQAVLEVFATL